MKIADFQSRSPSGARYLGLPCSSAVAGNGYMAGIFDDGAMLYVGSHPVYTTPRTDRDVLDELARVGNVLANVPKKVRESQIEELAQRFPAQIRIREGEVVVGGSVWTPDGDFLRLA